MYILWRGKWGLIYEMRILLMLILMSKTNNVKLSINNYEQTDT